MARSQQRRLELHALLEAYVKPGRVYYQPPQSVKMAYPCIVYTRSSMPSAYANNKKYRTYAGYSVTYITEDADSEVPETMLEELEYSRLSTEYKSDNLYHTVMVINKY